MGGLPVPGIVPPVGLARCSAKWNAGHPEVIPVEACHLGWHETLALLTQLVEANIPV